jgi:hypothetical protein
MLLDIACCKLQEHNLYVTTTVPDDNFISWPLDQVSELTKDKNVIFA